MGNNPLRIGMFGHKRFPSREGGVEVVVEELATRMAKHGESVTCFNRTGHHVSGGEYDADSYRTYRGVNIRYVPTIEKRGFAALTSSVASAFRCAFGPFDVVHIHAEGPAFMCWLPKLMHKRVIVTVHGLDWARAKWGRFASWYIRTGEKMAVRHADEIIVLSEGVKKYFLEQYGRETRFIPNGVNPATIQNAEEIKNLGLEKDNYILYLGRLVPEKGEHYLVSAFSKVRTDRKLVIAGGSSDTEEYMGRLKKMAAGDDRVLFTGFVQGRLLEELYSNAYVYVLPSDLEGMPLSLLEGMSYGNCCLVSSIPECADVVEDKGVVFKKGDIEDLQEKLQMLCDKPDVVNQYKSEAADFICRKYDWDDIVDRTLNIYRGKTHESVND